MNDLMKHNNDKLEMADDIIDHEIKLIKENYLKLNIKLTQIIKDIISLTEQNYDEDDKENK